MGDLALYELSADAPCDVRPDDALSVEGICVAGLSDDGSSVVNTGKSLDAAPLDVEVEEGFGANPICPVAGTLSSLLPLASAKSKTTS